MTEKIVSVFRHINNRLHWIALSLLVFFTLFPLYWGITSSFKSYAAIYEVPPQVFPLNPLLRAYRYVFHFRGFSRFLFNSTFLAVTSSFLAVSLSILAAYGFSRYKFKFSSVLFMMFLIPRIIPRASLIIPLFELWSGLGFLNSYVSLIVSYTATAIPLNTMVLTGFFGTIPTALEESAAIDGASLRQRIWHIILPLSKPAIITVAVMSLREAWNEFPFVLTLTTETRMRTLPYQLFMLRDAMGIEDWPVVLAFATVTIVPILVFYLIFQRTVTSGLIEGAIKE